MSTELEKLDKKKMQDVQQIFHHLLEITELYPQYTICQHLAGILRRKKDGVKTPYFWTNSQLLKHVESYKQELESQTLELDEEGIEDII